MKINKESSHSKSLGDTNHRVRWTSESERTFCDLETDIKTKRSSHAVQRNRNVGREVVCGVRAAWWKDTMHTLEFGLVVGGQSGRSGRF